MKSGRYEGTNPFMYQDIFKFYPFREIRDKDPNYEIFKLFRHGNIWVELVVAVDYILNNHLVI